MSVQSCLVNNFLTEQHWEFFLHGKIAYRLRVCHDFDTMSKVILPHYRSLEENVNNKCLVFVLGEILEMLTSHKTCLRPEDFDLYSRSLEKSL